MCSATPIKPVSPFKNQSNLEDEIHFKWGRFVTSQKSNKNKSRANPCFVVELDPFLFHLPPDFPIPRGTEPAPKSSAVPSLFGPRPARRTRPTHAWPTAAAISADALAPSLSLFLSPPFSFLFPIFLSLFFSFPSPFLSLSPSFLLCRARDPAPPAPAPPGRALHRDTPPWTPLPSTPHARQARPGPRHRPLPRAPPDPLKPLAANPATYPVRTPLPPAPPPHTRAPA